MSGDTSPEVVWVGKDYVAIKVKEKQIGDAKMGQGMHFVRKSYNPTPHVCGRECGVKG